MKDADILDRVDKLRVWQRGGQRAPHKPLLLLLALGRLSHD
jgi:putative restriction endonuclease